ncbi:MAG TPA: amidohydrolase family protein [Actinomycetota bacterium]|nr:amidohydrolase family protein [Actinomycetota bacterium]
MTSSTLLSGGCVLTLGARTPNFETADVLLEDGLVVEVGRGLRARDAERVDATDTIVMPGFVDTHRHAWTSLFRNAGGPGEDGPEVGAHFGPDDAYAATLIGLLGAAEAGITTVVDWSDLPADGGIAEAALQAHVDAGLRSVFAHAAAGRNGEPAALDRAFVSRLADAAGPSTAIAFGAPMTAGAATPAVDAAWATARELGLRIHAHGGSGRPSRGDIARLADRGLLADDVTLVHCADLEVVDVDAIVASGAAISLAPSSEMAAGLGAPPIQQLVDRDIRPGLGVDAERVTPGDLFAQMRATISVQHATVFDRKLAGKAGLPKLMSTRDVIRLATLEGARAIGLGRVAGSLEPGKQADVIVLRTDRPNVFPINDPIGAVVWGMDTSNVDAVFVGGRALMRDGDLTADVARARSLATAARTRVAEAAGLVGAAPGGDA